MEQIALECQRVLQNIGDIRRCKMDFEALAERVIVRPLEFNIDECQETI